MAAWCASAPGAFAQDTSTCAELAGTVGTLSTSPDVFERSTLETIASEAVRAHVACADEGQRLRTVYTLNQAVFALNHLTRYAEADSLTDLFFDRYAESATYEYRARFAAWRVHFATFFGDYTTAGFTIGEATAFLNALPLDRQIHLRLDLAYLYEQEGRYNRALAIIDSIQAEHGERLRTDSTLSTTQARVLMESAELLGKQVQGDSLDILAPEQIAQLEEAERRLEQSIGLYDRAGERGRQAEAVVILGDVRATLRISPDDLSIAIDSARVWSTHRSVVYGLWRRGRYYLREEEPQKAEVDFLKGLTLSDSIKIGEFDRYLALDLGRAYEDQGKLDEARTAFEEAYQLSTGLLGARWREEAQRHLRSIDQRESSRTLWLVVSLFAGLLAAMLGVVAWLWRRRPSEGVVMIHSLAQRERRRIYIHSVLFHAADVQHFIRSTHLRRLADQGLLKVNAGLFRCADFVEQAQEGTHRKHPAESYRQQLQPYFDERGWHWPRDAEAWRTHFETHPPISYNFPGSTLNLGRTDPQPG